MHRRFILLRSVAPPSGAYQSGTSVAVSSATTSFSLDTGTAAANRQIVLCVYVSQFQYAISAITVGGVSLTKKMDAGATNDHNSQIWMGNVPSGNGLQTVNVTGSWVGTAGLIVFLYTYYPSSPSPTVLDSASVNGASQISKTFVTQVGGLVVGGCGYNFLFGITQDAAFNNSNGGNGTLGTGGAGHAIATGSSLSAGTSGNTPWSCCIMSLSA